MPNVIVYVRDTGSRQGWYLEYSTVVDAPTTRGMKRAAMLKYLREEHGRSSVDENAKRLARAYANGSSYRLAKETAEQAMRSNRAGPHELSLTMRGIVEHYCRGGWKPSPDVDAFLGELSSWLRSEENRAGGVEPALLERVEPHNTGARVTLYRNAAPHKETTFYVGSALSQESARGAARFACRAALDALYPSAVAA